MSRSLLVLRSWDFVFLVPFGLFFLFRSHCLYAERVVRRVGFFPSVVIIGTRFMLWRDKKKPGKRTNRRDTAIERWCLVHKPFTHSLHRNFTVRLFSFVPVAVDLHHHTASRLHTCRDLQLRKVARVLGLWVWKLSRISLFAVSSVLLLIVPLYCNLNVFVTATP